MTSWRDPILAQFTPEIAAVARLTVVADPDRLLTETKVIEGVNARGFDVVGFDDHAAFRYAYERRFRGPWDRGERTNLVVVLRAPQVDVAGLPFDLIAEARRNRRLLSFSLAEIFPNLQPHVVSELDRRDLDVVFEAQRVHQPGKLGLNATREFLLRQVYEVAPELIKSPSDLLRVLLRRHYSGQALPPSLDEHVIQVLRASGRWSGWPLESIVSDRAAFMGFLQERWPVFVKRKLAGTADAVREPESDYGFRYSGPLDLPFDHDDVRVYIDNLFVDGHLTPTLAVPKASARGAWFGVGLGGDAQEDRIERLSKLLDRIADEFPPATSGHRQWLTTAERWAEALAIRWTLASVPEPVSARLAALRMRIDQDFGAWLDVHYAALSSLAPLPRPTMLHHVTKYLAHGIGRAGKSKHALLVVDGLSLDQWAALRHESTGQGWTSDDASTFAWIPTLTSVSRQSIFAAEPPFFFAPSIGTTSKEEQHWTRFWEDQGLVRAEIAYACQKSLEDDDALIRRVRDAAEDPRCRVLAVVVGTVDAMLHGTVTGSDGLHASVRHWAKRQGLAALINAVLSLDFEITLTADHGNVESLGVGRPNVGLTADERGERVHVFRDQLTRASVAKAFPGSVSWRTIGLPDDYLPLIAPNRCAFIPEGKRTVAHGGACLEEVVVPFVKIRRAP